MLGWFFHHIDDVRSDMSVFHRVDDLESVPMRRLVPLMVRLPVYDGAVRWALQNPPDPEPEPVPEPEPPAPPLSLDQMQGMNHSALYGPLPGQTVGLFDVATVPAT